MGGPGGLFSRAESLGRCGGKDRGARPAAVSSRESGLVVRFFSFWARDRRERKPEIEKPPTWVCLHGSLYVYRDIPDELRSLIEPVVADHGCELVDAEVLGRPKVVRITIDDASGHGDVAVESCAQISRELATHLDAAAAIDGSYRLEVSSPGLNRVLAREKDFCSACGETVSVRTKRPLAGRRRFQGRLLAFGDGLARVEIEDGPAEIPFDEIEKANLVYEFTASDFERRSIQPTGNRV